MTRPKKAGDDVSPNWIEFVEANHADDWPRACRAKAALDREREAEAELILAAMRWRAAIRANGDAPARADELLRCADALDVARNPSRPAPRSRNKSRTVARAIAKGLMRRAKSPPG